MTREDFEEIDRQAADCDAFLRRMRERRGDGDDDTRLHHRNEVTAWQSWVDERIEDAISAALMEIVAPEAGETENRLLQRQDTEVATLRAEIATLRGQVIELIDVVQTLASDVAELQSDAVDRSVVPIKRGSNAA